MSLSVSVLFDQCDIYLTVFISVPDNGNIWQLHARGIVLLRLRLISERIMDKLVLAASIF